MSAIGTILFMSSAAKKVRPKVLVSGAGSGLGRYIFESFGGVAWNRNISPKEKEEIKKYGADVVIHCAFNSDKNVTLDNLYGYFNDNVSLTQELLAVPYDYFIYISTIDVYSRLATSHNEEEIIKADDIRGVYGITKLVSESIVRQMCRNFLILRCSALLGKYSRKNTLIRMFEDSNAKLTLSKDSEMNYVLHTDVADFIRVSIQKRLKGVFNVVSSENVELGEIAHLSSGKISFGEYRYTVGGIDNSKAAAHFNAFKKTSKQVIREFIEQMGY